MNRMIPRKTFLSRCCRLFPATLFFLLLMPFATFAQKKKVMVMEIKAEIDPPMKRYVDLALGHAESINADIVVVEMDTYGGSLTDAKEIVDRIIGFKNPVWVFINRDAASAGAMISIACDSIYMAAAATIGAATVVDGEGEKAPDKYQSYARKIMRSIAEENHRDPRIAEKMVDEDIELDSLSPAGKVITFSTTEAIKYGFCEAKAESIEEILKRNKVENYELIRYELSSVDEIIAFFLNPAISGFLILLFIGGLYFELQTPGMGFPGLAALVALILYLVPYYLTGLADNWEIIALIIGLALIAVEIFILPGFGIAGIAGISLTTVSLVLIMLDNDFFNFDFVPSDAIFSATLAALAGLLGGIILLFVGGPKFADSKAFKRIALTDTQSRTQGYTSSFFPDNMKGKRGTSHTVLRPAGKVLIDGKLYDALTFGEYVERGKEIEVVGEETTSLRVKEIQSAN
jgi:membrane-bound serine protease (ClpP class)